MDKLETLEAIKVMQHFADGGEIEMKDPDWQETHEPFWSWFTVDYRIKEAPLR